MHWTRSGGTSAAPAPPPDPHPARPLPGACCTSSVAVPAGAWRPVRNSGPWVRRAMRRGSNWRCLTDSESTQSPRQNVSSRSATSRTPQGGGLVLREGLGAVRRGRPPLDADRRIAFDPALALPSPHRLARDGHLDLPAPWSMKSRHRRRRASILLNLLVRAGGAGRVNRTGQAVACRTWAITKGMDFGRGHRRLLHPGGVGQAVPAPRAGSGFRSGPFCVPQ